MPSDKTHLLLQWCSEHGLRIDPRLQVVQDDRTGIRVVATAEIPFPSTLVHIPKSAVLSVRSCAFAEQLADLHAPYGQSAQLALALALYGEILRGPHSVWVGYLQSLPSEPIELALLWGSEAEIFDAPTADAQSAGFGDDAYRRSLQDSHSSARNIFAEAARKTQNDRESTEAQRQTIEDGREARRWIRGTQIETELCGKDDEGLPLLEAVRGFYHTTAAPLLSGPGLRAQLPADAPPPRLGAFYHAYTLVSSRAFLIDAYHGLAMVPIADAFNHANDNHVHLQSEYDVCVDCGSLEECTHDAGNDQQYDRSRTSSQPSPCLRPEQKAPLALADPQSEDENACEMVSVAPVLAGTEVFNTYGAALSNAQLLARYGFMLDGNEHDVVSWDPIDLWRRTPQGDNWGTEPEPPTEPEPGRARSHAGTTIPSDNYIGAAPACVGSEGGTGAPAGPNLLELFRRVLMRWPMHAGWAASDLVCNSAPAEAQGGGARAHRPTLCVNADGRISHALWVLAALVALAGGGSGSIGSGGARLDSEDAVLGELARAATRQLAREAAAADAPAPAADEDDDGAGVQIGAGPPPPVTRHHAFDALAIEGASRAVGGQWPVCWAPSADGRLAWIVCQWCACRRVRIGAYCTAGAELGELLDALPPTMRRTRLAMTEALAEISLLESCEAGWQEMLQQ